jgi:hypothetical protein
VGLACPWGPEPIVLLDVWVGGEDGADGLALVGGKLVGKARGVNDLLTLVGGHLAEIGDGVDHQAAAGNGGLVQLLHGVVPLLLLLRAEALQAFDSAEHAAALLGRHVVELVEVVQLALLGLAWKLMEAGHILKGLVLFRRAEVLVILQPLRQVLLALRVLNLRFGHWEARYGRRLRGAGFGTYLDAGLCMFDGAGLTGWGKGWWFGRETAREGRRREQQNCCAEGEPGWKMQSHDECGPLR